MALVAMELRPSRTSVNKVSALLIVVMIISNFVAWSNFLRPAVLRNLLSEEHNSVAVPPKKPEDIKFIAVVGMYHTGSTAMWNAIHANEDIVASMGIPLKAYGTSGNGGYPPCGVPLLSDSSVDMKNVMGNSSGIDDSNPKLFAEWGTTWADWHKGGPRTVPDVMKMPPPHQQEVFYTVWKHTPPQHPILACHRPDTLYVVMVRHPKIWEQSMKKKLYDFKYESQLKQWRLIRSNPRRLPPLEIRFRSLFNAWEYYMNGYLAWEYMSAGKNCYAKNNNRTAKQTETTYCLGGSNSIPHARKNILIIRHEDYVYNPAKVLTKIFSFASRGLLNEKTTMHSINIPTRDSSNETEKLQMLKDNNFFSSQKEDWGDAYKIHELCEQLGYSCDKSTSIFANA